MDVLKKALKMLEKYPLCNHCLGRQFALLGFGIENDVRGKTIKLVLSFKAHALAFAKNKEGVTILKTIATNGFFKTAEEILQKMNKRISRKIFPKICFLCDNSFQVLDDLAKKALKQIEDYEYNNFLVGTEIPVAIQEREDEFKAEFDVNYSESMRKEFGRILGRKIASSTGKSVEFRKPELVILISPFTEDVKIQANPLFIFGRYRKLVRGLPQSKWFCSNCHGKGCKNCDWTGKMYAESIEEIIAKPFLEATSSNKTSFHASGREDIDVRMLGKGRPFIIEISKPKKRFLDLTKIEETINVYAKSKINVSNLKFTQKASVRKIKKAESAQKEYRVIIQFESKILEKDLSLLEQKLTNVIIRQRTPFRVLHRRADLTREKYIYQVKVKKLSSKTAEMKIRCQGGLYVKELVTGDEGRTTPSVSEFFSNNAQPITLDVLNVIVKD